MPQCNAKILIYMKVTDNTCSGNARGRNMHLCSKLVHDLGLTLQRQDDHGLGSER